MLTIEQLLAQIKQHLSLSSETEYELVEEIRTHLEDAVDAARAKGGDEQVALLKAAEQFGIDEVGIALQKVHQPWESADAIIACSVPVLAAIILRWLAFAPDGSALGWQALLVRPAFWIVAIATLVIPLIQLKRWQYAMVGWGFFWTLTIIFIVFPNIQSW